MVFACVLFGRFLSSPYATQHRPEPSDGEDALVGRLTADDFKPLYQPLQRGMLPYLSRYFLSRRQLSTAESGYVCPFAQRIENRVSLSSATAH